MVTPCEVVQWGSCRETVGRRKIGGKTGRAPGGSKQRREGKGIKQARGIKEKGGEKKAERPKGEEKGTPSWTE